MAWTDAYSWVPSATIRDSLKNVIALAPTTDTLKTALYGSTLTATTDTDPSTFGGTGFTGNEITGTNWTTAVGNPTLGTPTLVLTAGVGVTFSGTNVSVATTTLTGVYGCAIWDYTISATVGNNLAVIYFGGTSYSTVAGTFGINWSGSGIWYITLH